MSPNSAMNLSTPWCRSPTPQSGQYTTRDLERLRDRNLIGILKALETNHWAAGKTLAEQRARLSNSD